MFTTSLTSQLHSDYFRTYDSIIRAAAVPCVNSIFFRTCQEFQTNIPLLLQFNNRFNNDDSIELTISNVAWLSRFIHFLILLASAGFRSLSSMISISPFDLNKTDNVFFHTRKLLALTNFSTLIRSVFSIVDISSPKYELQLTFLQFNFS